MEHVSVKKRELNKPAYSEKYSMNHSWKHSVGGQGGCVFSTLLN